MFLIERQKAFRLQNAFKIVSKIELTMPYAKRKVFRNYVVTVRKSVHIVSDCDIRITHERCNTTRVCTNLYAHFFLANEKYNHMHAYDQKLTGSPNLGRCVKSLSKCL